MSSTVANNNDLKTRNQTLHNLAYTDPLTELHNRRYLDEKVPENIQTSNGAYAFLMIDLDYFKGFNDKYGHAKGDIVLKAVADAIRYSLRKGDDVVRLGGEEDLGVMYGIDDVDIERRIQRLHKDITLRVKELTVGDDKMPDGYEVSVSIGAVIYEGNVPLESALQSADEQLYRAKEGGRNQTIVLDLRNKSLDEVA